ncbi:pilin [Patescibacteria group bacterium]|nr:pilin [Patescibacteria group bacterium]
MSKTVITLFVILLQLTLLTPNVVAADSCNDASVGIQLDQNFFPENASPSALNFTISNSNTTANLSGKNVFFRQYGRPLPTQSFDSKSSQTITSTNFSVELDNHPNELMNNGPHEGDLFLEADSSTKICSDISYQIGATGDKCFFDQDYLTRNPIVPGGQITINFIGRKETTFHLKPRGGGGDLATTITGDDGQGSFNNVTINGNNGDIVELLIVSTYGGGGQTCYPSITLSLSAHPPESPPPGPINPPPVTQPIKKCGDPGAAPCTTAGGNPCGTSEDPGFNTAIGCIRTNLSSLVNDFLTFIIGISGGLAFLMMLLGAFQMLTSAGNPETINTGRERLTSAIIGLLFVIFTVLLLQIIGADILSIPGFKP